MADIDPYAISDGVTLECGLTLGAGDVYDVARQMYILTGGTADKFNSDNGLAQSLYSVVKQALNDVYNAT